MTTTEIVVEVIRIAADELAIDPASLKPETRLDAIFSDSLEYVAFTIRLADLGHIPDAAIAKSETLGDLADALVHTN